MPYMLDAVCCFCLERYDRAATACGLSLRTFFHVSFFLTIGFILIEVMIIFGFCPLGVAMAVIILTANALLTHVLVLFYLIYSMHMRTAYKRTRGLRVMIHILRAYTMVRLYWLIAELMWMLSYTKTLTDYPWDVTAGIDEFGGPFTKRPYYQEAFCPFGNILEPYESYAYNGDYYIYLLAPPDAITLPIAFILAVLLSIWLVIVTIAWSAFAAVVANGGVGNEKVNWYRLAGGADSGSYETPGSYPEDDSLSRNHLNSLEDLLSQESQPLSDELPHTKYINDDASISTMTYGLMRDFATSILSYSEDDFIPHDSSILVLSAASTESRSEFLVSAALRDILPYDKSDFSSFKEDSITSDPSSKQGSISFCSDRDESFCVSSIKSLSGQDLPLPAVVVPRNVMIEYSSESVPLPTDNAPPHFVPFRRNHRSFSNDSVDGPHRFYSARMCQTNRSIQPNPLDHDLGYLSGQKGLGKEIELGIRGSVYSPYVYYQNNNIANQGVNMSDFHPSSNELERSDKGKQRKNWRDCTFEG